MTLPITPNPGVHQAPVQVVQQQQFATPPQLATWSSQLVQAMTLNIVNAILNGLGLGAYTSGIDQALIDLENALAATVSDAGTAAGYWNTFLTDVGIPTPAQVAAWLNGLYQYTGDFVNFLTALVPAANVAADTTPELLTNPGFDDSVSITPHSPQITWDGSVGRTNLGSLLIEPDGEYLYSVVCDPGVSVVAGAQLLMSAWVQWLSFAAGGSNPIRLEALCFLQGARVASYELDQITSPPTNQTTWLQLIQTFTVPTGVDTVYLRLLVDQTATAGWVWFDDASLQRVNVIPAAALEALPPALVQGIQGLEDIGTSLQQTWDNLWSALTGSSGSGVTLSQLAAAQQEAAQLNSMAAAQALSATNVLQIQDNQAVAAGLEATVESSMTLSALGPNSTPTQVAVTQGASSGALIRIGQSKTLGFTQCIGYKSGTITDFYINTYMQDSSGDLDLVYSSSNLTSSLPTSWDWILNALPGPDEIPVVPGDVIGVEAQVVGPGTVYIAGLSQTWQTDHPSANTPQSGFTQNWGTGSASTIAAADIGYTGSTPYVGVGVSNLPINFEPPQTSTYDSAGSDTWTPPVWLTTGTFIDIIAVGAGAGGWGAVLFFAGQGGLPGSWGTSTTLVVGTDIPASNTLTVNVGAGGAGGVFGSPGGAAGGASTVEYHDMSSVLHTITAAGGADTGNFVDSGGSPGNETYLGLTYTGGTSSLGPSLTSAAGSAPGGGGPGAASWLATGWPGADGSVWIVARQT